MPLAVTHVILTIILVDLYRDYITKHKGYFTLWTVFIAGVGGLLPDLDIPINGFLTTIGINAPLLAHGGILHTPLFALVFLIPGLILWFNKKHKLAVIFFAITFGIMFHLFLDYLIIGGDSNGIMFLYPFSTEHYKLFLLSKLFGGNNMATFIGITGLDAIILLLWLFHEEWKHKIKDYI